MPKLMTKTLEIQLKYLLMISKLGFLSDVFGFNH